LTGLQPGAFWSWPSSHFCRIEAKPLRVVINVNGSIIGTHAGLYVDTGGKVLYDPSGSYKVQEKGSGDALYEDEADLADYIHFQERDGSDVEVFYFPTTPEDDKQIIDRIQEIGGCGFAECTVCSSSAVRGIGPFKTLGAVRTPLGFAKALRELQKK
jgi:hypothetical protein